MRTAPRSTRRTLVGKENLAKHSQSQRESVPATSSKKARHRLSTAELARLEDVFRQETHPSRQQKKDLAAELGIGQHTHMYDPDLESSFDDVRIAYRDYKTVTIWFQNKRQTSKRGQPPGEKLDRTLGRTRADSCLRTVSSPSQNATLDASEVDPAANSSERKGPGDGLNTIAAKAIVKIKPLLDSLNALTSRPRGHSESRETKGEVPIIKDIDPQRPQTLSENSIVSAEFNRHAQIAEQEQTKEKPVRWKRIRTLEWACERQAKRRKLSREAYARLGSEEVQDHSDSNDTRMDSALSLLSLASSTEVGPPKDLMRGVSLLLSFKHSWRRK